MKIFCHKINLCSYEAKRNKINNNFIGQLIILDMQLVFTCNTPGINFCSNFEGLFCVFYASHFSDEIKNLENSTELIFSKNKIQGWHS
jgi:hypothetical protein